MSNVIKITNISEEILEVKTSLGSMQIEPGESLENVSVSNLESLSQKTKIIRNLSENGR